jgi:hypothetical protein
MMDLKLQTGPTLIYAHRGREEDGQGKPCIRSDVTAQAHEFLFDSVALCDGVTLCDIFRLLEACPELQAVMRRNYCAELLAEAQKGVSPEYQAGYAPEAIEYLELYQQWHLNSLTREYQPNHRLNLHGVGYALREPMNEAHGMVYPVGHRIQWGVSTSNVRELLSLPLRLNSSVQICEDDLDARQFGQEIEKVSMCHVSLGQILHGVLWELSWHGSPADQLKLTEELKAQVAEIDAGTAKLTPMDDIDLFNELDVPGCRALFVSIGGHKPRAVSYALRELEDDAPVADGLRATFADEVVVKPEFAALGARAFKKLFREARYPVEQGQLD